MHVGRFEKKKKEILLPTNIINKSCLTTTCDIETISIDLKRILFEFLRNFSTVFETTVQRSASPPCGNGELQKVVRRVRAADSALAAGNFVRGAQGTETSSSPEKEETFCPSSNLERRKTYVFSFCSLGLLLPSPKQKEGQRNGGKRRGRDRSSLSIWDLLLEVRFRRELEHLPYDAGRSVAGLFADRVGARALLRVRRKPRAASSSGSRKKRTAAK